MWHQLIIKKLKENELDILEPFLIEAGALSVTYADSEDDPVLEPAPGETKLWKKTDLIALFDDITICNSAKNFLVVSHPELDVEAEKLEDEVWERAWEKGYEAMNFGEKLCICPSHKTPADENRITVFMNPGLAFGSGTHQTTALCLSFLDSVDLSGKTIIDYGCGSGILGISALKLGAKKVYATDIDKQALESTLDNAKRNDIDESLIKTALPDDFSPPLADILIANILAGPIIELKETFHQLVMPGGTLVLSGILDNQSDKVCEALAGLFTYIDKEVFEGWVRLTFVKEMYV